MKAYNDTKDPNYQDKQLGLNAFKSRQVNCVNRVTCLKGCRCRIMQPVSL